MSRKTHRMLTKADRRARSRREGLGDAVIGVRQASQHRWMLKQLLRLHAGRCALCGEAVVLKSGDPREATIDHVVPLAHGGLDVLSNTQLACAACNHAKGAT